MTAPINPFATHRVRPGAIAYESPEGESAAQIAARFLDNFRVAQILGPHGSGKSTLLEALTEPLEAQDRHLLGVRLQAGDRHLPRELFAEAAADEQALIVVDGCEQLGWWPWRRLRTFCRRHGRGLLVTTHRDLAVPTLCRTRTDVALARRIASQLQAGGEQLVLADDVQQAFERHQGNLREVLFDLYDLYEQRRG